LKLEYDEPLSKIAFKFNLRRYGWVGQTTTLTASVEFSDGTQFSDAASTHVSIGTLLVFSSDTSSAVSVSGTTATLKANHWKVVSITAAAVCSTGAIAASALVSASVDIAANLAPALGDVDLGYATGVQFPAKSAGQLLDVAVRVNSQGSNLLSYQIDIVW